MTMNNSFSPSFGSTGLGAPGSLFLNQDPRMAYRSFQNRFGQAPRQRSFYDQFFPQAQDEFLGVLGEQVRGGMIPSMQFSDFLQSFPFMDRYRSLPPAMRGGQTSRFNPVAQFNYR